MELNYKYPSDLTGPIHNKDEAPTPAQPEPCFDSDYMDGTVQAYDGANPGRDQDRQRVDDCRAGGYSYSGTPVGKVSENETGAMEGY